MPLPQPLALMAAVVLLALSLTGAVAARMPEIGALAAAVVGGGAYLCGRYAWERNRPRGRRIVAGVASALGLLFLAAAAPFCFVEKAVARFEARHSAGAGVRPGMTLDEARAAVAADADVLPLSLDDGAQGVRFQREPKGLAGFRFSFPIAELYYLDVRTGADGKVASVRPWRD